MKRSGPAGASVDRLRKLTMLATISKSLAGSLDTDEILKQILAGAVAVMEAADAGFLSLYDPPSDTVRIRAAVGFADEIYDVCLAPGEGMTGKAFKTGRCLIGNDAAAVAETRVNLTEHNRALYREAAGGVPRPRRALAVPLLLKGVPIGAMTIENLRTPHRFTDFDVEILETLADQAAIAIENARLYAAERESRLAFQRSLTIHQSLTRLVLEGHAVGEIACRLAELLQKPVAVTDAFLNVIASGGTPPPHPAKLGADALGLGGTGANAETPAQLMKLAAGAAHVLVVPITGPHETLGAIVVGPTGGELGELDHSAVGHAATAVGLSLLRERAVAEAEISLRGDILEGLITAQGREVDRRAAQLGLDPAGDYGLAVVVARRSGEPGAPPGSPLVRLKAVAEAWAGQRGDGAVVEREGMLVALKRLAGPESRETALRRGSRELAAGLKRAHPGARPLVAVAPVCRGLRQLGPLYTEVTRAVALLVRAGVKPSLVSTEALGVYRLLLQIADTAELLAFADQTLAPLEQYDATHAAQLVPTLRGFLESNRRIGVTAERLCVHPHSVKYRLHRAHELRGWDDERPDQWLQFELALRIRDMLVDGGPVDVPLEAQRAD